MGCGRFNLLQRKSRAIYFWCIPATENALNSKVSSILALVSACVVHVAFLQILQKAAFRIKLCMHVPHCQVIRRGRRLYSYVTSPLTLGLLSERMEMAVTIMQID